MAIAEFLLTMNWIRTIHPFKIRKASSLISAKESFPNAKSYIMKTEINPVIHLNKEKDTRVSELG